MFIYKVSNIITQEFYIGQTRKTLEQRFKKHVYNARYGVDTHLYNAMRKYGETHFTIEAIESQVPDTILNEREIYHIATLKPQYNMNEGGSSGNGMTQKHKRSMAEYHATRPRESYATYGTLGTKKTPIQNTKTKMGTLKPCCVKGRWFFSGQEARDYYKIGGTTYYRWKKKGLVIIHE